MSNSNEDPTSPYTPPKASVQDVDSEESIRRDGKRLVVNLYGGLHSICAHCGSTDQLVARTDKKVYRNPVGCFSTLGLFLLIVVTAVSAEHIALPDAVTGTVVAVAAVFIVIVNALWRSRYIELSFSLCLACRARRGRWIIYWLLAAITVVGLYVFVDKSALILLLPIYLVAARLQPVSLTPTKMVGEQVWLRGVKPAVLDRFPSIDSDHLA